MQDQRTDHLSSGEETPQPQSIDPNQNEVKEPDSDLCSELSAKVNQLEQLVQEKNEKM